MHALSWHRQAMGPPTPLPDPLSATGSKALSDSARIAYASRVRTALRNQPLRSPIHDRLADQLTAALDSVMLEPPGARTILSLSAPFAAGKSTMIKQWAQGLHRAWVPDGAGPKELSRWAPSPGYEADAVPISYVTLLADSTGTELYAQLLAFARWDPGGTVRALVQRTVLAMENHGTRLVILDDAHFLRTVAKRGRATLDAVKHLNTELGELGGVLVLVGANLTDSGILDDDQIRGRLAPFGFGAYEIDTDEGRRSWQRFLKGCESVLLPYLPRNGPGDLAKKHSAFLWVRTQGVIGDASRLLIEATAQALREERRLDRTILSGVSLSQRAQDRERDLARRRRPQTSGQKEAG